MRIFESYTGNAMLNNALMTIESLAKLKTVSEVTTETLTQLYEKMGLKNINKRLKSYTMIFSLNNPLVNPAKKQNNAGEKTYHYLLNSIMNGFENEGQYVCEISGLRFNKTFDDFYKEEIDRQKKVLIKESKDEKLLIKELKNLENTDTSLNRSWFPLIGGLGSDAQALPQAKFSVQIHPICIPILQFLPLSALLYKGGILLVDSSNFHLAKEMVARNTQIIAEKIQAVSVKDSVENVRDFSKGDYLLKVLEILYQKDEMHESYSDLNMWSFSNSGTGASCEIDRVPNSLIKKIQKLNENPLINIELKSILGKNESAYSFIECIEGNRDWFLLYPNLFTKKKDKYDGVSTDFLEAYYKVIKHKNSIDYAKYIAGLIQKYKTKEFEKLLVKTDAWNDGEFRIEMFKVLVEATKNGEWSLEHQIQILDDNEKLPVKNHFYQLHKLIHYYIQKDTYSTDLPKAEVKDTKVFYACKWLISIIQNDSKSTTISNLIDANQYLKVGFNRMIIDAVETNQFGLENVLEIFFDNDFKYSKYGLNELLRLFFTQPIQEKFTTERCCTQLEDENLIQSWKKNMVEFLEDYKNYYFEKYQNPNSKEPPTGKYSKIVNVLLREQEKFKSLLNEAILNTNHFFNEKGIYSKDKWDMDSLMANPLGNPDATIGIMAVKFLLKEQITKLQKEQILIKNN